MSKNNQDMLLNSLKQKLKEQGIIIYKGFIIKTCKDHFGIRYYTILNKHTGSHVHADDISTVKTICDNAHMLLHKGFVTCRTKKSIKNKVMRLVFNKNNNAYLNRNFPLKMRW